MAQSGALRNHNHSASGGDGGQLSNLSVSGTIASSGNLSVTGTITSTGQINNGSTEPLVDGDVTPLEFAAFLAAMGA